MQRRAHLFLRWLCSLAAHTLFAVLGGGGTNSAARSPQWAPRQPKPLAFRRPSCVANPRRQSALFSESLSLVTENFGTQRRSCTFPMSLLIPALFHHSRHIRSAGLPVTPRMSFLAFRAGPNENPTKKKNHPPRSHTVYPLAKANREWEQNSTAPRPLSITYALRECRVFIPVKCNFTPGCWATLPVLRTPYSRRSPAQWQFSFIHRCPIFLPAANNHHPPPALNARHPTRVN